MTLVCLASRSGGSVPWVAEAGLGFRGVGLMVFGLGFRVED